MANVSKKLVYIAGSMRNRQAIIDLTLALRQAGYDVFNDWAMPGEATDEKWQEFEMAQGHNYFQALEGPHAQDVFEFDKRWLDRADAFVLVAPAGKSAHTELGYCVGTGKPSFLFLPDEPERWDIMVKFATAVCRTQQSLIGWLEEVL